MRPRNPASPGVDEAIALLSSGAIEPAERILVGVMRQQPGNVDAQLAMASLRGMQGRYAEAVPLLRKALGKRPGDFGGWMNLGSALLLLNRHEKALEALDRAVALNPAEAAAHANRARALVGLQRFAEGAKAFETASRLDIEDAEVLSHAIEIKRKVCDWESLEGLEQRLIALVRAGRAADPLLFSTICAEPALLHANARLSWAKRFPPAPGQPHLHRSRPGADKPKIRIGYLSHDFREHATAYLMAELFEGHDRERFEIIALSYGFDDKGPMRTRLRKAFDRFIDVEAASDREIAERIAAAEIDILVDLKGYTPYARLGMLAMRPAPIQCQYIGYPGTLGSPAVDYIIGDRWVTPAEHEPHFSEAVVRLPGCYQVNDRARAIADPGPTRAECGLPQDALVFCCFNSQQKVSPGFMDIWCRILARVPGSVLWMLSDNPGADRNLKKEAKARGIDPDRIVIAGFTSPLARHLARLRLADLQLDTLPYCAHTTASDALWAGLPIVTCLGTSFAGRVGASLVDAIGAPELITRSLEDYERLAVELACDRERLAAIRAEIQANRDRAALFDTPRFRRNLEAAFETIWAKYRAGEKPCSFDVADQPVGL